MTGLMHEKEFSRKSFLSRGGALVVGFSMIGAAGVVGAAEAASASPGSFPIIDPGQLDSWLRIDATGHVWAFTGRVDQGQGKETSYAQTVADELNVPLASVTVVMGDTARTPNQGKSTATNGITTGLPPLRNAAAQAHQTLLGLASGQLGVPVSQLSVVDGVVSGGGKSVTYAQLVGGKNFGVTMGTTGTSAGNAYPGFPYPPYSGATTSVNVVTNAPLKDPSTYAIVGKSVPRVDIPDKVTGKYVYTQNIHLPGMVHARVINPPWSASYPAVVPQLLKVKGFRTPQPAVQIVRDGNFLAVVAEQEWRAIEAATQLDTEWSTDANLPNLGNPAKVLRSTPNNAPFTPTDAVSSKGTGFNPSSGKLIAAQYDFPYTTHGMIGPSCGLASWDPNTQLLTVYTGMQNPPQTRADIAQLLGLNLNQIRVLWYEQSSMFGRGGVDDVATAAALISKQISKPVRVQWMRADEHVWGPHMPGMTQDIAATLNPDGSINSWYARSWGTVAGWDIGYSLPQLLNGTANGLPHGTAGSATAGSYAVPNQTTIGSSVNPVVRPMYMRTVAGIQTTFISESFMDELAAAVGVDPIQYRLNHLDPVAQAKAIATLTAVQQLSGWESRPSPAPKGTGPILRGRGVGLSGAVAHVAEVEVERKSGRVRATRISVAVNIGSLVSPDATSAQVEGGTLMGLSRALRDQVVFGKNRITSADWVTYPILRFMDVPASIDIAYVPSAPAVPAGGIGEPSSQNVPAAVGNAIFDATGVRMRSTPFTPARVRAAMKEAGVA
jgi:CO/xanthine dehydrogenase Mo-binding subunit